MLNANSPTCRSNLAQMQTQLETVSGNMALAKTPEQFEAISRTFDQLKVQEVSLRARIADAESKMAETPDPEAEIAGALGVLNRLTDLITDPKGLELAGEAFRLTGARLFMRFQPVHVENRVLNKVAGGVVVFGAAPDPIDILPRPNRASGLELQRLDCLGSCRAG